jgi:hypothetical protein
MTAGLDIRGRIWRINYGPDDDVGGAMVTGTVAYDFVQARLTPAKTSSLLLEQGIEAESLWNLQLRPTTMAIRERDEFEVTYPANHWNCGQRFRIISVQYPSMHPNDGRGFISTVAHRRDTAHGIQ